MPGMVVHICNLAPQRQTEVDQVFKASDLETIYKPVSPKGSLI